MSKLFKSSGIVILLSVLLVTSIACKAEYSLRAGVGGGQGSVTPESEKYKKGDTATIAAVPASGWEFSRWEYGNFESTDNPLVITMDSDKTVVAYFNETASPNPTPSPRSNQTPTPTAVPSPTPSATLASTATPAPTTNSTVYYFWVTGPWSACSAPCGGGTQMRYVECMCGDTTMVVEDSYCMSPRPVSVQTCNTGECPTPTPTATAPPNEEPTPTPTSSSPTHQ